MGGEAERDALRPVEPRAGQRQELGDAPAQAREVAPAADVGEEADRGLRHGEDGALGRDPVFAGAGDADAAAHRDPVHEHDPALGVRVHEVVHPIFLEEEGLARRAMALARPGDGDDIAAGAEAPAFRMIDQDQLHRRIGEPILQRAGHRADHVEVEGVERLGPVQAEAARPAFDCGR